MKTMGDAKILIAQDGQRYAAIPLERYAELERKLEQVIDELELLKAERTMESIARGDEALIPADVVGRVIADGVSPLKAVREWRGLGQAELAQEAQTSRNYISQIETGHRQPGRQLLQRLAKALKVPVDALMP